MRKYYRIRTRAAQSAECAVSGRKCLILQLSRGVYTLAPAKPSMPPAAKPSMPQPGLEALAQLRHVVVPESGVQPQGDVEIRRIVRRYRHDLRRQPVGQAFDQPEIPALLHKAELDRRQAGEIQELL